jgi:D-lactate dehydrogenase
MKTLIYSIHGFDKPFFENHQQYIHQLEYTDEKLSLASVSLAKGFDAIALFSSDNASSEVLIELNKLGVKFIALRSVGYDHIDLIKAKELGIKVANVPAYSPYAIAEHSVALLMTLNRKVLLAKELSNKNDFRLDELVGFDLFGKTIGVVGTGKIGAAFCNIMNGFGAKILAYDIEENEELKSKISLTYTSLDKLCMQSNVISLNCPLNQATKHMFNKELFSIMKKGVIFINTARGGVVNTLDLIEAIENDTIGFAGLDVYEFEKPIFFKNHQNTEIKDEVFQKLRAYPNVLITGHQAFLTNEALTGITNTTIENLTSWQLTGTSPNELY